MVADLHFHFHDGELAKLLDSCVSIAIREPWNSVKGRCTTAGQIKKYERREEEALAKLQSVIEYISPQQIKDLDEAFEVVERYHKSLASPENVNSKLRNRLATDYKSAVKVYAAQVNITSSSIIKDLEHHKGNATAFKMRKACSEADCEAVQMIRKIRNTVQEGASGPTPTPEAAPTTQRRQDSTESIAHADLPEVIMDKIATSIQNQTSSEETPITECMCDDLGNCQCDTQVLWQ